MKSRKTFGKVGEAVSIAVTKDTVNFTKKYSKNVVKSQFSWYNKGGR